MKTQKANGLDFCKLAVSQIPRLDKMIMKQSRLRHRTKLSLQPTRIRRKGR